LGACVAVDAFCSPKQSRVALLHNAKRERFHLGLSLTSLVLCFLHFERGYLGGLRRKFDIFLHFSKIKTVLLAQHWHLLKRILQGGMSASVNKMCLSAASSSCERTMTGSRLEHEFHGAKIALFFLSFFLAPEKERDFVF